MLAKQEVWIERGRPFKGGFFFEGGGEGGQWEGVGMKGPEPTLLK